MAQLFSLGTLESYERRDTKCGYWSAPTYCSDVSDYPCDGFPLSLSHFSQEASFVWDAVCGSFSSSARGGSCGDLHRARYLVVARTQRFTT
jgi:hypothetical protein